MIDKYKFYYSRSEYIVNKPEEIHEINGHKVSKNVYYELYRKILKQYELHITQECYWDNHISKANSFSKLTIFKRKEK